MEVCEHGELARGDLVERFTDWQLPLTPVSLVYSSREHLPQRHRVFRDFVIACFDAPQRAKLRR